MLSLIRMKHDVGKEQVIREGKQKCQMEQTKWIGERGETESEVRSRHRMGL